MCQECAPALVWFGAWQTHILIPRHTFFVLLAPPTRAEKTHHWQLYCSLRHVLNRADAWKLISNVVNESQATLSAQWQRRKTEKASEKLSAVQEWWKMVFHFQQITITRISLVKMKVITNMENYMLQRAWFLSQINSPSFIWKCTVFQGWKIFFALLSWVWALQQQPLRSL